MERPEWAPEYVDMNRPNVARMYDYFLGGAHNFAVDREAARALAQAYPGATANFRGNRSFLRRAVWHLVNAGIDQFLDLGSGIPTVGNVHEIAQQGNPGARVVYVDVDPVTVAHARTILGDDPRNVAVRADLRHPEHVLDHPDVRSLLDLDKPIALIMIAALDFVSDSDDPAGIVAGYRRALAPGSHVVISHGSLDDASATEEVVDAINTVYGRAGVRVIPRTRAEVAALFDGLELIPPGLVPCQRWCPDSDDQPTALFVGVGRLP